MQFLPYSINHRPVDQPEITVETLRLQQNRSHDHPEKNDRMVQVDQGSHRPGKVLEFDLGPGKLLEFENSAFCSGNVLEFCKIALETSEIALKIIKYINSFGFM